MIINILAPDSKIPNLAAMKISAYHKAQGDEVWLNMPLMRADKTYASILFEWTPVPIADVVGGPGYDPKVRLPKEIDTCKPDYSLYPGLGHSIGYTYRACHRGCSFCKVKDMNEPNDHYSIWSFHDPKFKKIAILNNNTFEDSRWRETFEEIWDAQLRVIDHSGFDARLFTEDKAIALAKTKFEGQIHISFDDITVEPHIRKALSFMVQAGVKLERITVYILMGFNSSPEDDIARVRLVREFGALPFAMIFKKDSASQDLKRFARLVIRPAVCKSINWQGVKTYKDIL